MSRISPRLVILPLAILTMAAGLSWWTSHQRAVQAESIERTVRSWCDRAARGEDPYPHITADAFVARPLGTTLLEVCRDAGDRISVSVAVGAGVGHRTVDASHHAVVRVDGAPRVGINFFADGGRNAIVGFWTED